MARAKRHYIAGQVWHLTHRCHKREFLLRFAKDRRRWLQWLFEAKRRYGLLILNYTVTSNHIHLQRDSASGVPVGTPINIYTNWLKIEILINLWTSLEFIVTGIDPTVCPHCGKGKMVLKEAIVPTGAPP